MPKRKTPTKTLTIHIPDSEDYREWSRLATQLCRNAWEAAHPKQKRGRPSYEQLVFAACRETLLKADKDEMKYSQNYLIEHLANVHPKTKDLHQDTIKGHVMAFFKTWPSSLWPQHKLKMNPGLAEKSDKYNQCFLKIQIEIYWPWLTQQFRKMMARKEISSFNEFCELEQQGKVVLPVTIRKKMDQTLQLLLKKPS